MYYVKENFSSPSWAEAKAVLFAVSIASCCGLWEVIFEGNSNIVIDSLNRPSFIPLWDIRAIISDIQLLFPSFSSVSFTYMFLGLLIGLAHSLAHWGSFCSTWGPQHVSSIPSWAFCKEFDERVPPLLPLPSLRPQ